MCTVEDICCDTGKPLNPLKSFANPLAFKTAMTRASSLVIAVGDPSQLIKAEDSFNDSRKCWEEFISLCKKNNTFLNDVTQCTQVGRYITCVSGSSPAWHIASD